MTMAVDIADSNVSMDKIKKQLDKAGEHMGLKITFQNENIFKAMHRI
jgi:predicted amino acid-binding ACT domain protein